MRTYEKLADALAAEAQVAFALLGDGNMFAMAGFAARPGTRLVQGRHENAVVAMADAYARASGRVGLCSVTDGPGLTQVITSLVIAAAHRVPLVVFAGAAPIGSSYNIHGFDQQALAVASGARFVAALTPDRVQDACREAFSVAATLRCPVVLSVPIDVMDAETTHAGTGYTPSARLLPGQDRLTPPDASMLPILQRIRAARHPVVVAGRGAVESAADDAVAAFAAAVGALTGTSLRATGMFRGSPWDIGIVGGYSSVTTRELLAEADCVVGIGAGMGHYTSDAGRLFPRADRIQIDLAPVGLHTGRFVADAYLRGDARATVERLLHLLGEGPAVVGFRTARVAAAIASTRDRLVASCRPPTGESDGVHPMEAMLEIDDLLTDDLAVVIGGSHSWAFPLSALSRLDPRGLFALDDFGVIGQGLSAALGVAVARGGQRVVCIDGDGSTLMQIQELETAVRSGIDVTLLVLNDGAYGAEVHKLDARGLDGRLASFGRPRFARIAEAFGATGERAATLGELRPALSRALTRGGVNVLDIWIDATVASPSFTRTYFGDSRSADRRETSWHG